MVGAMKIDITKDEMTKAAQLPMLEKIMASFVNEATDSLRQQLAQDLEVFADKMIPIRLGDYNEGNSFPTLVAVFHIPEWHGYGMVVIQKDLVYAMLELLLGGGGLAPSLKVEGRLFTNVEKSIMEGIASVILNDLKCAFATIVNISFIIQRVDNNPTYALPYDGEEIVILQKMKLKSGQRSGDIDLVLPYHALRSVRSLLTRPFSNHLLYKNNTWKEHFIDTINDSMVNISVEVNNTQMTLGDISNAKVGDTLITSKLADDDVGVKINGSLIAKGRLGKIGDKLAVQLNGPVGC